MNDRIIEQYTQRARNTIKLLSRNKDLAQKNQTICQELGYRLMILREAQEKMKVIAELVSQHDTQALTQCTFFLRQVTNTDGPGFHDIQFKDSVREKDKESPEKMNRLIGIINSFDDKTLQSEALYREKCAEFIDAICEYVFYHREIYMPTTFKKGEAI